MNIILNNLPRIPIEHFISESGNFKEYPTMHYLDTVRYTQSVIAISFLLSIYRDISQYLHCGNNVNLLYTDNK